MKNTELLNTQTSVENTDKKPSSTEIVQRIEVENSPLVLVGNDEDGWYVTLGRYRLSKRHMTEEAARKALQAEMWNIIMRMTYLITENQISSIHLMEQNELTKAQNNDKN